MISDEAVEAAAKASYALRPATFYLDDAVVTWDQLVKSSSGHRRKAQQLAEAHAALEAAAPHIIREAQAEAWDEGYQGCYDRYMYEPVPPNPYRSQA